MTREGPRGSTRRVGTCATRPNSLWAGPQSASGGRDSESRPPQPSAQLTLPRLGTGKLKGGIYMTWVARPHDWADMGFRLLAHAPMGIRIKAPPFD